MQDNQFSFHEDESSQQLHFDFPISRIMRKLITVVPDINLWCLMKQPKMTNASSWEFYDLHTNIIIFDSYIMLSNK